MFYIIKVTAFVVYLSAFVVFGGFENEPEYLVGAGIFDITGPASGLGMMGYAQVLEKTKGILQRLFARAFIFAEKNNPEKRLVFVVTDLGMVFQSVHQGVLQQLKAIFGDLYTEKNVMLNATHTHAGPGGFSHYLLYNLTTFGFDEQNYTAIVNGIVYAILRAHENLAPSTMRLSLGQVPDASFNRSPEAYELNPPEERARYPENVDRTMVLLRMDSKDGPFALLNWFAVHGTSLDNENLLISGDNKGYAEIAFERLQNSSFDNKAFVAGFAQEAAGDVSPNESGKGDHGEAGVHKVTEDGNKQLETALSLFNDENAQMLTGELDYRQTFVNMAKITIAPEFTAGDGERHTCPSAIGISMLAGALDGPGFGKQGVACHELAKLFGKRSAECLEFFCDSYLHACQAEKPVVLSTGTTIPPLVPQILPFQIFRIGTVAIVGLPFEITTMSGRRIKELVKNKLAPLGVDHVVVAGLCNAYAGYITTREEYRLQRYEGASNQFGPYSLNAILQILDDLSTRMLTNQPDPLGPTPPDLSQQVMKRLGPIFVDRMPFWEKMRGNGFGSIKSDVDDHYEPLDTVKVDFWGAHLANNLLINDSFLFVEKLTEQGFVPVFFDRDIETSLAYKHFSLGYSVITISWRIPKGTEGLFRIRHKGFSKDIERRIKPYEGVSSVFSVIQRDP